MKLANAAVHMHTLKCQIYGCLKLEALQAVDALVNDPAQTVPPITHCHVRKIATVLIGGTPRLRHEAEVMKVQMAVQEYSMLVVTIVCC